MPEHKDNWIYVIWLQIVDPYNSNPSRDFYEGYSVGLQFPKCVPIESDEDEGKIIKEGEEVEEVPCEPDVRNEPLETNNVYEKAYRGVLKLEEATGRHDELLYEDFDTTEQTDRFAWVLDLQNTMFI